MNFMGLLFWLSVLFILYVYLGYPLLLALLARFSKKQTEYAPYTPKITLLIAAYNEEKAISSKLENALSLDYPSEDLQILVAADGSDDHTVEIVKTFASRSIELSYQPKRQGKMAAINSAIALARHEIIIFSDANNLYNEDTLRELVKPFSDIKVGAVSGSKNILDSQDVLSKADSLYWRYESYIKEKETQLSSCTGVSGEILAVRRNLYQPPPAQVINDDFFIALNIFRQGYKLVYMPKARSFEYSSLTVKDEDTRRSRIVAGRYQAMLMSTGLLPWRSPLLIWQIVSHKFMRPFVPMAMILAFFSNLLLLYWAPTPVWNSILNLAWPYNLFFFFLQLFFYLLAWAGNTFNNGTRRTMKFLYLPAFLVNSNLSALRGLFSFFTGKQTALWRRARRREDTIINGEKR